MSERKYRQRGYQQDEPRAPRTQQKPAEKKEYELSTATAWSEDARCSRCGADLHACAQCANFDTSAPLECTKPVPVRITPKDTRNACTLFEPRTVVERETKSAAPTSARKAFDDLFK
jgi:hypothetical protein